jgi:redox-sensitive bicupin YhaK (pirin superfamily)
MTAPRYQDILARDIPEVVDDDGTAVRVICGRFWGRTGPVEGVAADPRYLDVSVPPGRRRRIAVEMPRHAFAYVFAGSGTFRDASQPHGVETEFVGPGGAVHGDRAVAPGGAASTGAAARHRSATFGDARNRSLVVFDGGDEVVVQAGEEGIRFLLVSGRPLEEPVAWYGPIVMNTKAELQQAIAELRNGTFIRD